MLAGGGHSHVIVLRMLGMNPIPGLRVTLISPETETPYSGMLPGVIAGHYDRQGAHIDLAPLCRFAGAAFIRSRVDAIDPDAQEVRVSGRPPIRYDVLSIDVGSTPSLGGLNESEVIPVKPISSFLSRWDAFLKRFSAGDVRQVGFVGGGAGGTELCLAVAEYLDNNFPDHSAKLNVFTDGKTILREFPPSVRIRFEKLLDTKRINVHRDFRAVNAHEGLLLSNDGREVSLDEIFCTTQASAQSWPQLAGLSVDEAGFIQVKDTLQTLSHDNIYAVGDCATMVDHPRPKAGVFAVRQGMPLFRNIKRYLLGEELKPFRPQKRFLALLTMGAKHAVASRNGLSVEGDWVWRWKHWIDQRFMQRFTALPLMEVDNRGTLLEDFDTQMHCGGCGSKVSSDLLSDVLAELMDDKVPTDDAAIVEVPAGQQLIQSVDHLRGFVEDPYVQARIAVCHAFSDIYACGGRPASAMAMLTLPFAKPDVTRGMLKVMMTGILEQLEEEGATLIGGHTSEGAELSVGFTANGLVKPGRRWAKTGVQPDDVLILTKALGTGTILAADMQRLARGVWVETALSSMMQSNRMAAEVLADYPVSACTDITGFGLAGHCLEMLAGGHSGISLTAEELPLLVGVEQCLKWGVRSTLHEANQRSVLLYGDVPGAAKADIIFDPQTSGGLLVGMPAENADACVAALKAAGCERAAIIGAVTDQSGLVIDGGYRG